MVAEILKENFSQPGGPVARWRARRKNRDFEKKMETHHMIPFWKLEGPASILVKKSSKNINF